MTGVQTCALPIFNLRALIELVAAEMEEAGATVDLKGDIPAQIRSRPVALKRCLANLMDNARRVGELVLHGLEPLRSHAGVHDVRGLGLMIGVEFETDELADTVQRACFERGLLVLRAGDETIRMSPPLVLTEAEAREGVRIFGEACASAL